MPRNISMAATVPQVKNRTKTVTRRIGWKYLKPGTILNCVEKSMGLQPGQKVKRICQVVVTRVNQEPLSDVSDLDVKKEGFPDMTREQFIKKFKSVYDVDEETKVTRIEFEYL